MPGSFPFRTRVSTPNGPGYVEALVFSKTLDTYLVSHDRAEFSPEDWKTMSELNAPSVFRQYHVDQLEELQGPVVVLNTFKGKPVSMDKVIEMAKSVKNVNKATKTMAQAQRDDQAMAKIVLKSRWATARKGDRYEVIDIKGDLVKLSWLDGKYTRDVTKESLLRNYTEIPNE